MKNQKDLNNDTEDHNTKKKAKTVRFVDQDAPKFKKMKRRDKDDSNNSKPN